MPDFTATLKHPRGHITRRQFEGEEHDIRTLIANSGVKLLTLSLVVQHPVQPKPRRTNIRLQKGNQSD